MSTITIHDLAHRNELDSRELSAVQGGYAGLGKDINVNVNVNQQLAQFQQIGVNVLNNNGVIGAGFVLLAAVGPGRFSVDHVLTRKQREHREAMAKAQPAAAWPRSGAPVDFADAGYFATNKPNPQGEIWLRGPSVLSEYYENPEETAAAMTADGWFKTGDIGAFDSEGFLTITGRKKEILVTAGGKNVAPAALEDPIRANPIIGQVVVVGDQKPFISALITLDLEMLPTWLANNDLPGDMSLVDAAKNPAVRAEVQKAIDIANKHVSRAESIRKFKILSTEWSEASGHLTPKMSIKRNVILKDFSSEVDALYNEPVTTNSVPLG